MCTDYTFCCCHLGNIIFVNSFCWDKLENTTYLWLGFVVHFLSDVNLISTVNGIEIHMDNEEIFVDSKKNSYWSDMKTTIRKRRNLMFSCFRKCNKKYNATYISTLVQHVTILGIQTIKGQRWKKAVRTFFFLVCWCKGQWGGRPTTKSRQNPCLFLFSVWCLRHTAVWRDMPQLLCSMPLPLTNCFYLWCELCFPSLFFFTLNISRT